MIGWLEGRVRHELRNGAWIIDVGGVGYEVQVATNSTPPLQPIELFIYTVVRADALILYGFLTLQDREFFELLLVTPGVGPATALGALRTMTVGEMTAAIEREDVKQIVTISGIGPKTASRIVLELRGKFAVDEAPGVLGGAAAHAAVYDALRALGYSSSEVRSALNGVELPESESDALRVALAQLRHG